MCRSSILRIPKRMVGSSVRRVFGWDFFSVVGFFVYGISVLRVFLWVGFPSLVGFLFWMSISKKYILSLGRQTPRMPRTRSATWGHRGLDRWLLETPGDARETLGDTRETHRRHRSVRDAHDTQKTPNKPLASRDTSRAS